VAGVVVAVVRDGQLDKVGLWIACGVGIAVVANQLLVFAEVRGLISAHASAVDMLSLSEERFRLAFESAPVGMAILENQALLDINPVLEQILGVSRDQVLGRTFADVVEFESAPPSADVAYELIAPSVEGLRTELCIRRPNGTPAWVDVTIARAPGSDGSRRVVIAVDVTEQRGANERLAHLAVHDQLTGLMNRAAFTDAVTSALDDAGEEVAIAFIDLDRFKVINDSLGHAAGDQLLVTAARRIEAIVGPDGVVARFAGDEFVAMLRALDRGRLEEVVEAVRRTLSEPLAIGDGMITYPGASIGVAVSDRTSTCERLLADSDAAMYRAKERGRNRVEFFERTTTVAAGSELRLVGELHRALAQDEFRLVYQPVVHVPSGRTTGYEALIRWEHPDRGLLAPAEFLQTAEESGLIVDIGEWVLREAIAQLRRWQDRHPERRLTMAVNVAARQVADDYVSPDRPRWCRAPR
jgi:diguanylate cyclase (GGDEF)-like protein/PAS domain S-box-containing protein